ncbi:DNA circularization N-terminal domain-containing protein [Thalassospira sp.]|uniref:DNA circularization protein n=1 Tax=Thalassospira sp. TaxID=1912094 RepID=UPI000C3FBE52|nr:DNA circularization N-terminal domain-containing protein [Thalassospira sp.]MBC06363.1 hypothetical protein [Thalassospira sp.]
MSWKDKLRPASYKGARFHIEGHDSDVAGREVQVHEYPGRDVPYPEDMRRKTKNFSFAAYVIGDDYMTVRDQLISACDSEGAGTLVHPYLGSIIAICTGCKLSERADEGRMARLQLTFVEGGTNQFPTSSKDQSFALTQAVEAAHASNRESFANDFSVAGKPAFLAYESVDVISEATNEIDGAVSDQGDGTFARALSKIGNEALTFVQNPSGLANQLGDLVVQAGEAAGAGPDTMQALRPIAQFGTQLASVPLTTATRKVQALNQNAVVSLVTNSAVIEMARNVIDTQFVTTNDAFATRDEIGGYLDTAMDRASEAEDDQLFETLRVLRTATTDYINAQSPRTAQLINTVAPVTEPALVTAYRLYQDAGRADEIATRNGVAHPGFVPGGEMIEVLSNV